MERKFAILSRGFEINLLLMPTLKRNNFANLSENSVPEVSVGGKFQILIRELSQKL